MAENYGQGIKKSEADQYFKRFYDIRKRSLPKLKAALQGDRQALRYYCGKGKKGENQDWAFVFDVNSLKRIMAKIKEHKANGVFIFHGAKTDGAPTVMILPSTYQEPKDLKAFEFVIHTEPKKKRPKAGDKALSAAAEDAGDEGSQTGFAGEQHPGTGGGSFEDGEAIQLPKGFFKGQYRG